MNNSGTKKKESSPNFSVTSHRNSSILLLKMCNENCLGLRRHYQILSRCHFFPPDATNFLSILNLFYELTRTIVWNSLNVVTIFWKGLRGVHLGQIKCGWGSIGDMGRVELGYFAGSLLGFEYFIYCNVLNIASPLFPASPLKQMLFNIMRIQIF